MIIIKKIGDSVSIEYNNIQINSMGTNVKFDRVKEQESVIIYVNNKYILTEKLSNITINDEILTESNYETLVSELLEVFDFNKLIPEDKDLQKITDIGSSTTKRIQVANATTDIDVPTLGQVKALIAAINSWIW